MSLGTSLAVTSPAARFIADDMPPEAKQILREAMFNCADRLMHDFFIFFNNMNQVTCMPMRLYAAYLTPRDTRLIAHSCSNPESSLEGNTLTIKGKCRLQPFRMERVYEFGSNSIKVTGALLDDGLRGERHTIDEIYEAIPINPAEAELFGQEGQSLGSLSTTLVTAVSTIRVGKPDKGLLIRLDKPRPVKLSGTRTLLIQLPAGDALYAVGVIRLSYTIEPIGDDK